MNFPRVRVSQLASQSKRESKWRKEAFLCRLPRDMRATLERLSNSMKRFKLPRSRLRKYRLSELFKKDKQVHTCLGHSSRALISRSVLSLSLDSHCWWLSFSLTDLLGDTALEIQTLWILSKVITVKFDNSAEFANFQSLTLEFTAFPIWSTMAPIKQPGYLLRGSKASEPRQWMSFISKTPEQSRHPFLKFEPSLNEVH